MIVPSSSAPHSSASFPSSHKFLRIVPFVFLRLVSAVISPSRLRVFVVHSLFPPFPPVQFPFFLGAFACGVVQVSLRSSPHIKPVRKSAGSATYACSEYCFGDRSQSRDWPGSCPPARRETVSRFSVRAQPRCRVKSRRRSPKTGRQSQLFGA